MQVKTLIEALQKMDPESHICALIYDKKMFDYDEDDDVMLTDAAWEKLCGEFDEQPFSDIWESIADGVSEYAEERPFEEETK